MSELFVAVVDQAAQDDEQHDAVEDRMGDDRRTDPAQEVGRRPERDADSRQHQTEPEVARAPHRVGVGEAEQHPLQRDRRHRPEPGQEAAQHHPAEHELLDERRRHDRRQHGRHLVHAA